MPFPRPTLSELRTQARADLQSALPEADLGLRRSNLRVFADVTAGLMHMHYGWLDWLARQVIPDTAETEYLERWARIFGLVRAPASPAGGRAVFAGSVGAAVPTGTRLQRADRVEYAVATGGTLPTGGYLELDVEAIEPGSAGNADAGVRLTLVSALAGVEARATVGVDGLGGGADAETDDSLRDRLLARIRRPPHGGAAHDYVAWARAVPGVTRAWAYPGELGLGTVTVRFMMDVVRAAEAGIPQPEDVAAVSAAVEALRPVTADVTVAAPVPAPLDVTIQGLEPDTPEVRAAIVAELADMVARTAEPGGTIPISRIWEAVSLATGERRHVIVAPAADIVHATGRIAVLGEVSHVP
jgi:uncharacterized phage protein gp47/JayE